MFLFVFWLRGRSTIKYLHSWGDGGSSSKMCTGAYRGRGVSRLMCTYALNEIPKSGETKTSNSSISEVKGYKETMANEQSQSGRGEYQIDEITYAKVRLL